MSLTITSIYSMTTPANTANTTGTTAKNPAPERAMATVASELLDVALGAPEDVETPVLCATDPELVELAEAEVVAGYRRELV
jgi:hypothetical protein